MREIKLSDGSLLEIKVNFLTLKLIVDCGIDELVKKNQKKPKDIKIQTELASKMIYVILRSNGKRVDEEEACRLVPLDDNEVNDLFNEFSERMEKFKKKQENRM